MILSKTHILSVSVLCAGLHAAYAQGGLFLSDTEFQGLQVAPAALEFVFRSDATYRQDAFGVNFRMAENLISFRDGQVVYDGNCASTEYVAPNQSGFPIYGTNPQLFSLSPCAGGTSGFISSGDFDNDGIADPGAYLSVTQLNGASVVEPKRAEKVMLISAPPSELPRPNGGFVAQGALLFYNIQTTFIRQYPLSQYFYNRTFNAGERNTYDRQIVEGAYLFNFPKLGYPTIPVPITVNYYGAVDGYREVYNQKRGFRFLGFTFDANGFARLDPAKANIITWEGNTADKVSTAVDQTFFSIKTLMAPMNSTSDAGTGFVFPPFVVPGITESRVQLPTAIDKTYTLPPGLIASGTKGLLQITLKRNRGAVIQDLSETTFSVPVLFMAPGSPAIEALSVIASKLPATATTQQKSFDNDFDGDGLSNFAEWVFDSNPGDANSVPVAPRLGFEPATTDPTDLSVKSDSTSGNWVFRVAKKTNTVPALQYAIENSVDMNAWTKVSSSDPHWQLVETEDEIKVVSRTSELTGGSFFRVCVEEKK